MELQKLINRALSNELLKEELSEKLLDDLMGQLDVLDPAEDGDKLLYYVREACNTTEGSELLAYLLGTKDVHEWFEEFSTI